MLLDVFSYICRQINNIMMYQYNKKKFKELQERLKLTRSAVRVGLEIKNDVTVKRWLEGEDLHISRLIQFCNKFAVSPLEFIDKDGVAMSEITPQTNIISSLETAADTQKKISRSEKLLDYYEKEIESKDKEIERLRTLLSGKN